MSATLLPSPSETIYISALIVNSCQDLVFLTAKAEDIYCQYGAVPPAAKAAENAARPPDAIS